MIGLDLTKSKIPGQNFFEGDGQILWLSVRCKEEHTERDDSTLSGSLISFFRYRSSTSDNLLKPSASHHPPLTSEANRDHPNLGLRATLLQKEMGLFAPV